MSEKAKWIWYPGDFELYHHMLLSERRQELGTDYPCMWRVARPEVNASFYRCFGLDDDEVIHVYTHSKGYVKAAGRTYPVNTDIPVKKGRLEIVVELFDIGTFPSFFIDGKTVKTDGSWTVQCGDRVWKKVGCEPEYTSCDDDPAVFPFEYETLLPCGVTEINGGKLYDMGKETFAVVRLDEIACDDEITLICGESKDEALDYENAIIREKLTADDCTSRPARAFRYLFVGSKNGNDVNFTAEYEYLPIKDIASFECDDDEIGRIFDVCSYTFHLNSREFFLDGIKRDRWVWSGDAYQSYIINRYLYADNGITKRTITALLGKPEYHSHINTINDYSAFVIISVWEYYYATGDIDFVGSVWDKVKSLCSFIMSRLDENGFVVCRSGDWIFIDWGDIDKDGTLCAEQILLHEAYVCMDKLGTLMNEKSNFGEKAEKLKKDIISKWWREDKSAFIDCFDNGREHISKQTNILAILYGIVDGETALKIKKNVIDSEKITPVTTPYFKLYELIACCMCGDITGMQKYLKAYWGGMLKLGATSVWEQYDPSKSGSEHYAMYGKKYGKSLCHAWGSGPVYLLGRFVAGVKQTSLGYETFSVEPHPGIFGSFKAVVPVGKGKVSVSFDGEKYTVLSDVPGGVLMTGSKKYDISANEILTAEAENIR